MFLCFFPFYCNFHERRIRLSYRSSAWLVLCLFCFRVYRYITIMTKESRFSFWRKQEPEKKEKKNDISSHVFLRSHNDKSSLLIALYIPVLHHMVMYP